MPEGPSLVILRESLLQFKNRKITDGGGYTKMPTAWLKGETLLDIKTWGKHLLLCFRKATVRIHLRLFGSALINDRKKVNASFFLRMAKDEVNFYVVEAQKIDEPLAKVYDWRTDIMSPDWDSRFVRKLVHANPDAFIGDLLLDQDLFSGAGNIIRNEVLYRCEVHPLSKVNNLPAEVLSGILKDVRVYGKFFLKARKAGNFAKSWDAHQQKNCHRDGSKLTVKIIGKTKRKAYFCAHCQEKY